MMGVEGQAAQVNLVAIAKARGYTGNGTGNGNGNSGNGRGFNMNSRDSSGQNSSLVSDGKCTIMSTPHGSITSGKC
jgi:hypothetical protein